MKDKVGREIDYLRISITDRCNLRCKYCMPGDIETTDMENLLTYEEIVQVTETAAALGIRHIRLTGGEPLVRRGCVDLVEKIKNVSGIETVGMTTNGVLLAEYAKALKEAGLDSVNVSLDTLDETEFQRLTGRDELNAVLAGINAAKEAQIPVKINTVHYQHLDWKSILDYTNRVQIPVRFIEMMPIGYGKEFRFRGEDEICSILESAYGKMTPVIEHYGNGPCHYYEIEGFQGKIGFISAMTHKFCSQCNRVRMTAEGYLKACLQYQTGISLKALMRNGCTDEELTEAIRKVIWEKPGEHHFTSQAIDEDELKLMSQIGG